MKDLELRLRLLGDKLFQRSRNEQNPVVRKEQPYPDPIAFEIVEGLELGGDLYERLIAGERIRDVDRKAFSEVDHNESTLLRVWNEGYSGSLGFVNFRMIVYPSHPQNKSIYIAHVGVEPEYRIRKIGSNMLGEIERVAGERGANSTWAHVYYSDRESVLPFMEKQGYQIGNTTDSSWLVYKNLK